MQFTTTIVALSALAASAFAAPVEVEETFNATGTADGAPTLVARDNYARVTSFSGSGCGGSSSYQSWEGTYNGACWSQGGNSIEVTGAGCYVTTWSGTNCEGSSFTVPNSDCQNVPYGSISVTC